MRSVGAAVHTELVSGVVRLERWSADDLPLLVAANTPEMTTHLGGPESADDIRARHERYLRRWQTGEAFMYRIVVDGAPAGGIGFWPTEHEGEAVWEAGWNVLPAWQGRGVARDALRLLLAKVAVKDEARPVVAYPSVNNPASNALCRRAGFEHRGRVTELWRGAEMTFNIWVLDMSPLDRARYELHVDERFAGPGLDPERWWPYYLPHWSSREAAASRWSVGHGGLELRIDPDTAPWAPELDGDLRVSHLQSGQHSGPLGSGIGQHRSRAGLRVREEQPDHRGLLVRHGVIEVRMAAVRHPDVMVAFWPIGFEQQPDDCGEICIAEIFGGDIDEDGGLVGVGVKAQHDPRLRTDFQKVRVDGDLTQMHDYAVEWTPDRLRFFIDGRWVRTVAQAIGYPVQLMLDIYEFPRGDGTRDLSALPHVLRVERVRTYRPR